ncbi:MAG: carbohydrate ABC transporter permease [Sphaerochaetaceae bacterium]|nr:carbohydrate ABC transporter permease [Sphaerochaetaceae bacterium]
MKNNVVLKSGMVETHSRGEKVVDVILILVMALVAFVCVVPLWHCLISSISDGKSLMQHEGLVLLPVGGISLEGYGLTLRDSSIMMGYLNTIIYVLGNVAFGTVLNILAGYVLSRKTKLKSPLTAFVVFTMIFSGGTVPLYMVCKSLGMVGTRWALILPHCTNASFIIMSIKAFESVPQSTVEAARIDGAGHLRVIFQIMLPQCFSYILVTIVNTAIIAWNAWLSAAIYVPSDKTKWPLQLWIRELVANNAEFMNWSNPNYSRYLVQYCVIAIATIPLIMCFPLFIKRLEKGMAQGAEKG